MTTIVECVKSMRKVVLKKSLVDESWSLQFFAPTERDRLILNRITNEYCNTNQISMVKPYIEMDTENWIMLSFGTHDPDHVLQFCSWFEDAFVEQIQ